MTLEGRLRRPTAFRGDAAGYGSIFAVALPITTTSPSWFTVVTDRSTRLWPSSSRTASDLRRRGQRIARPHLAREADAVGGQPAVADKVGDHAAGHAHRQHAVGEDGRVLRYLGGEDLVGVERVVVARGAGVLDDLGAGEVVGELLGVGVADLDLACLKCHSLSPQSLSDDLLGAHADAGGAHDEFAGFVVVLGDVLAEPQVAATLALPFPGLAGAGLERQGLAEGSRAGSTRSAAPRAGRCRRRRRSARAARRSAPCRSRTTVRRSWGAGSSRGRTGPRPGRRWAARWSCRGSVPAAASAS